LPVGSDYQPRPFLRALALLDQFHAANLNQGNAHNDANHLYRSIKGEKTWICARRIASRPDQGGTYSNTSAHFLRIGMHIPYLVSGARAAFNSDEFSGLVCVL
jgi:hypothetical protein